jgi:hypothetical protein
MMNRMSPLALAALLLLTMPLAGCFEDLAGQRPYEGPDQVEFAQRCPPAPCYGHTITEGTGELQLQVNLIGAQRSSASEVTFSVVDLEDNPTTAVRGTHYELPNNFTVTIPANSSFGYVNLDILDADMPSNQQVVLHLQLGDSPDGSITAAENMKNFTVTIRG